MGRARTTTTAIARVLRRFGREVFADQVREGRLHTRGLPRGVRALSRLGMVLFWLVAALALASSLLGLRHDRELASGLVDLLLSICLGLLNVCAQPMGRGWRAAGVLLSATSMIPAMLLVGIMVGTGAGTIIFLLGAAGMLVLVGALAVLMVLTVMRPGLQPWRLWLAGAVGGLGHLTAMVIAWGFPFARSVNELSMMITDVALLFVAVPLAAASGISFAQVATDTATWSVLSVRQLLSPVAWVVVTALTCLGALAVALFIGPARWSGIVATLAHTLVSVGLCALGLRIVGRPVDLPRPTALTADLSARGMAFGALMCSWLLLLPLTLIPGAPLAHMPMGIIGDSVTAVVVLVLWLRALRARRAVMAVLAPPIFCACAYSATRQLLKYLGVAVMPGLSASLTGAVLVLLALCQAVVWTRAGHFSPDRDRGRWAIVTMVAVEALIFPWRESVAQPLETIAQGSAAVLLAGLVWRVLTEAEYTHRDSPRFPAPARALFFVSQALLAAVFVLQSILLPDAMAGVINLNTWASVVDAVVGQGVQIGVAVGLLALGRWRVDPMDPADAVEEASIAASRRQRRMRLRRRRAPAGPAAAPTGRR